MKNLKRILDLITEDRLRPSSAGSRGLLIASESDKGRVINSASFRRLQQKAQVFPLDPNAAVRTRLTHSIEVSQVGRHLAQKIINSNDAQHESYEKLAAFVNIVETACLLHDIGNPPFGHLGESAIKGWFKGKSLDDLANFDGNPQGFRLSTFLTGADKFGFNLTCSLLLTTIKYPWTLDNKPEGEKKIGIFKSDYPTYLKACESLGWKPNKKFPLLRLMEAADDIAYSMSDLEDGLEKKIIGIDDLKREFGAEQFRSDSVDPFVRFKTSIINQAVEAASKRFMDNLDAILEGKEVNLIDKNSEVGSLLKAVNSYARKWIYSDESAEKIELAGRSALDGLLTRFSPLLDLNADQFDGLLNNDSNRIKGLDFEIRLLRRLQIGRAHV